MTRMSGICLFLISMRSHANMTKFEKSELIDANSPLRHLEFNSISRYFQVKQSFIETKHLWLHSGLPGVFFFFFGGWHISSPLEHAVYIPPPTTRETGGALLTALDLWPTILPQPESHWTWPIMVSYPTDMRGECQHIIPPHLFYCNYCSQL